MPLGGYAFSLRAQKTTALTGASVTMRDGQHFDVLGELKKGGGRIETDDPALASQLRRCPVLKEGTRTRRSPRSTPRSKADRAKRPRRSVAASQPRKEA